MKTKKIVSALFAVLMAGVLSLGTAYAQNRAKSTPESDFEVRLLDDEESVTIVKYTGKAANIVIPATIQGCPVKSISGIDSKIVESIVLPDGVEYIGKMRVYNLKSVVIPASVKYIADNAFDSCKLKNVVLPEGVKYIGESAFNDCYQLESINLPESIEYIGRWAFSGCENLKSLSIPSACHVIGKEAFGACNGLTEVKIPGNIKLFQFPGDENQSLFDYCFASYSTNIKSLAVVKQLKNCKPFKIDPNWYDNYTDRYNWNVSGNIHSQFYKSYY